jgi:DNA-binding MurR/RpiR family transcriptional regulator
LCRTKKTGILVQGKGDAQLMVKSTFNRGSSILRVQGVIDSLKSAERRIAEYILENPEDVVNSTIEELAEKTKSSYATISRFCKKIGFSGYKEFKSTLINDLASHIDIRYEDYVEDFSIGTNTPTKQVCEMVHEYSVRSIEHTALILDVGTIDTTVEKLIQAHFLYCIGSGTSNVSAHYAYIKFFRLGIPCQYEADSTLFRMRAGIMTEQDVLLAISSSGRTPSVIDAARIAKENGAFVISLSDFAISPLTKISDLNLYTTPKHTNMFTEFEMPLIQGQISIIDILFACCGVKKTKSASKVYDRTRQIALEYKSHK